jgi:hypothetical protein
MVRSAVAAVKDMPAVDYDVSGLRRVSGNFFSPARTAGVLLVAEEEISGRQ